MPTNALYQSAAEHLFGISTWTAPSSLYVGLSTTAPNGSGGNVTEPSGDGYARVEHTDWVWNSTLVENNGAVTFPTATASWGTPTYVCVFDAESGGNVLFWSEITPQVEVKQYDTTSIADADITFQFA